MPDPDLKPVPVKEENGVLDFCRIESGKLTVIIENEGGPISEGETARVKVSFDDNSQELTWLRGPKSSDPLYFELPENASGFNFRFDITTYIGAKVHRITGGICPAEN